MTRLSRTVWIGVALALVGSAVLFVMDVNKRRPINERVVRQGLQVGPEFPIQYRSLDCRVVSFAEFAEEHGRLEAGVERIMAPAGDRATVSIAVPGAKRCPEPYELSAFLPEFDALDIGGERLNFMQLRGKPTLVSYFWEDCPSCIREIEHLNALAQRYPGLQTLSVTYETAAVAREYAGKHGLTWRVLADQRTFINQAGVRTYPTLDLYGVDGRRLGRHTGWPTAADKQAEAVVSLRQWLDSSLEPSRVSRN